jgi:uncharacterized protein (DUF433 family)
MGSTVMTEHPYVVREERKRPSVRGTRILVQTIVGYYKLGYTIEEILSGLPNLTPAQVYDALSYYHDHQAEIESDLANNDDIQGLLRQYGLEMDVRGRVVGHAATK